MEVPWTATVFEPGYFTRPSPHSQNFCTGGMTAGHVHSIAITALFLPDDVAVMRYSGSDPTRQVTIPNKDGIVHQAGRCAQPQPPDAWETKDTSSVRRKQTTRSHRSNRTPITYTHRDRTFDHMIWSVGRLRPQKECYTGDGRQ